MLQVDTHLFKGKQQVKTCIKSNARRLLSVEPSQAICLSASIWNGSDFGSNIRPQAETQSWPPHTRCLPLYDIMMRVSFLTE